MARRTKALTVTPLALPAELTIYTVGELHPQWLAWLQQGAASAPAEVQAEAVEQVDGAGLQLLLSLARATTERGRALRLLAPSEVLRTACASLGLTDWLHSHAAEGLPA
jgi:anti-anti-sigma factor